MKEWERRRDEEGGHDERMDEEGDVGSKHF